VRDAIGSQTKGGRKEERRMTLHKSFNRSVVLAAAIVVPPYLLAVALIVRAFCRTF